jgi:hypothetical protein
VHGTAGPGRTLAQFVHPGDAIRIDIFRSIGQALARAEHFHLGPLSIAVLSIEDQAARATSLCMKVARDGSVVAKHHSDFVRMRGLVSPNRIEAVWKEYRREIEPLRFADAVKEIEAAVEAHPGRLIDAEFNRDPNAICPSCGPWGEFRPADPVETFRILGYA